MYKKFIFVFIAVLAVSFAEKSDAAEKDYCVECHKSLEGSAKDPTDNIESDVHFKRGLSCSSCHGGDSTKEDFTEAKDPAKGFVGKPDRNNIPNFCGKCHADPAYMRRFNPNIQTDQLAKYNESQHGKLNAGGDRKVAVCVSCHGVHGIREANDPQAPVFITNIPRLCASCHADKEYMKEYSIPTDQMEEYEKSVHGEALLKKGDRGAPACTSCHGSHDAALPRTIAIGNVCAQCHSLTRDLFAKSPHKAAHDKLGIPECEACHGNHKILRASDDMLGSTGQAICIKCHTADSEGYTQASSMKSSIETLKHDIEESENVVEAAEKSGMEMSDAKFDLDEAKNSLTKARAYIHTFSKDEVSRIAKEGDGFAAKAKAKGKKAVLEFKFRYKWLAAVLGIILLLASALYLKIRGMERK